MINFPLTTIREAIGVRDLGDAFREPVESDVPILCISGTLDVHTPPSNAKDVLRGFPNGRHLVIENAGHGDDLLIASPQIAECISAFFNQMALPTRRIVLQPIPFFSEH